MGYIGTGGDARRHATATRHGGRQPSRRRRGHGWPPADRAAAFVDQSMEPIEAYEEWKAAMETESMKGNKR
ncbi:hypothetical protein D9M69_364770 [compost metagenome]